MLVNKNIIGKTQYTLPYIESYRHKLDVIQNYFPHHPAIGAAIATAAADIYAYPYHDGRYQVLIAAICDYLTRTTQDGRDQVTANNITLTNGSDSALKLLIEAFVTPASRVMVPVPTYPHFQSFLDNIDKADIVTPYITSADQLLVLDFDKINVCYLVTPNLPLGYVIGPDTIDILATNYQQCLFVVDEAYIEFGGGFSASWLAVSRPNVAVVRTFSKAFGLAGLRIGYLIMSAAQTATIGPLVNDKSVTAIAQAAALAALQNVDYYLSKVAEVERLKTYISNRLDDIVDSTSPIFDYSMAGGNFFMLYAHRPQQACDIFAAHGIMVRNKHGDVANSIRICMGPIEMMKDVIRICKLINVEEYVRSKRVIFDLDLTLRNGASHAAKLYESARLCLDMPGSAIVSNNSITPEQVANYLARVGNICISQNRIQTSLSAAKRYINSTGHKVLLFGSDYTGSNADSSVGSPVQSYFEDAFCCSAEESQATAMLLTNIKIDSADIINICSRVSAGLYLIYTDESLFCDISNTNEFAVKYADSPSFRVPDMLSYVRLIKEATGKPDDQFISVGKPYMDLPPLDDSDEPFSLMIGDSDSDYEYAKRHGLSFIRVGAAANKYNFDKKYIELKSIDDIFN